MVRERGRRFGPSPASTQVMKSLARTRFADHDAGSLGATTHGG